MDFADSRPPQQLRYAAAMQLIVPAHCYQTVVEADHQEEGRKSKEEIA